MMRWVLSAILAVATMVLPVSSFAANCNHAVQSGSNSWQAMGSCQNEQNAVGAAVQVSSHAAQATYSYTPVCERGEGITGNDHYGCGQRMECGRNGTMFTVTAHLPDGSTRWDGPQCFESGEEPPTAQDVTPGDVLEAFRRIPVPESEVTVQPPGGETLVHLETVFSTEAEGFTRTVGLLGRRVDLDIWASEFRWVQGDGTTQVTDWAGRPWRAGTDLAELITHRYDDAQRGLDVRVDTTWSARYRVDGGPWRDVPGTVVVEGEAFDLTVLAAEPKLAG